MSLSARSSRRARALVAAGVAAVMLTSATAASAHPFGPPLTARLEVQHDVLTLWWTAAEDDWVTLARHVGVFDEPLPDPTDDSARIPGVSGLQRIQQSPQLREYLLEHLGVTQDGAPCTGDVVDMTDLLRAGVGVRFDCPREITEIQVQASVLTDVHEAYRTVATTPRGAAPRRALYTATAPIHTWDFSGTESTGETSWTMRIVVGVGAAVLVGAALVLLPTRSNRSSRPTPAMTTRD